MRGTSDRYGVEPSRYLIGNLVLFWDGIKNIRTKCLRSNNPRNVVRATIEGLASLKCAEQVARLRGKAVEEL